jgi:uncharacterized membrane protein YgcG
MNNKRMSAMAIAVLLGVTSCACLIGAEEDEGAPLIITAPAGTEPMSCAVFFADNMVYAPQWRLDNYVRIEMMVLNTDSYTLSTEIKTTDTDLYPETYVDGLAQQAAIIADSATALPLTKMVSVSYIEVTITSDVLEAPIVFKAGWDPVTLEKVIDDGNLGREVNKAGHLIYGMLWDTTHLDEGVYTVEVRLGKVVNGVGVLGLWYDVDYAIAHIYNPDVEGEFLDPLHPYSDLVLYDDPDYLTYHIGEGGLTADAAWIELGPLIPQGSGGGSGDGGGNGGDGGNGNGGGGGGNGHGGKLSQTRGSK